MHRAASITLATSLAVIAWPLAAQRRDAVVAGVSVAPARRAGVESPPAGAAAVHVVPDEPPREVRVSWWTPLASAALPGSGQLLLRQDRFVAYAAVEAYAWLRYAADLREGRRQRTAYRALADEVARAFFADAKPRGSFDYYERMEAFVESGVYDRFPGGALEPELDANTFNGSLWLLARRTYWSDPDDPPEPESEAYQRAIEFYRSRAVRPEFRWSWRNAQLEQDVFRRTIDRSNDAFRRSVTDLGIVLANHVLSTVDAFVSVRLIQRDARAGSSFGVAAELPWAPFGHPPIPAPTSR